MLRKIYRKYCLWKYHKRRQSIAFGGAAHKYVWDQEQKWRKEHFSQLQEIPE
jgi:hypothetical protein